MAHYSAPSALEYVLSPLDAIGLIENDAPSRVVASSYAANL
jgi:hypothetical protein